MSTYQMEKDWLREPGDGRKHGVLRLLRAAS